MVKKQNKTIKIITNNEKILEKLISGDYVFRKISESVNFYDIISPYYELRVNIGA